MSNLISILIIYKLNFFGSMRCLLDKSLSNVKCKQLAWARGGNTNVRRTCLYTYTKTKSLNIQSKLKTFFFHLQASYMSVSRRLALTDMLPLMSCMLRESLALTSPAPSSSSKLVSRNCILLDRV